MAGWPKMAATGKFPVLSVKTLIKRYWKALLVFAIACLILVVALSLLLALLKTKQKKDHVVVNTDCGKVVGRRVLASIANKTSASFEFKYIPYAEPPRRWKFPVLTAPENHNCWDGDYPATRKEPIICKQRDFYNSSVYLGTEDCLYLSIRSPDLTGRRPVMVWIHGGYFMTGHSEDIGYSIDSEFVTSMDVVGVNINYRLNAFGFLTLRDFWENLGNESYGNFGLADQITALKWIQKNIAAFGGDPKSVTIVGQSAGGSSVIALLSSPQANGLFHAAMSMSGAAVWPYNCSVAADSHDVFLDNSGCQKGKSRDERVSCMLNLSSDEVLRYTPWYAGPTWDMNLVYTVLTELPTPGILIGPIACIDSVILPSNPLELGSVNFTVERRIPFVTGTTAQEGAAFSKNLPFSTWNDVEETTKAHLDMFNNTLFSEVWFDLYKNGSSNSTSIDDPMLTYWTMVADLRATCANTFLAEASARSTQHEVYSYLVEHRPSAPIYGTDYAIHGLDAYALFNYTMQKESGFNPTAKDIEFTKQIRSVVKQLLHAGTVPETWLPVPRGSAVFSNSEPGVFYPRSPQERQCRFWLERGFFKYGWSD